MILPAAAQQRFTIFSLPAQLVFTAENCAKSPVESTDLARTTRMQLVARSRYDRPMGDHYLTQGYLRAWETNSRLWLYDRLKRRSHRTQAKSVTNENGMYSPELERRLANTLDGSGVEVLRKFDAGEQLSDAERRLMATFLFVQWKRVPSARARFLQMLPATKVEVEEELLADVQALELINNSWADRGPALRAEMSQAIKRFNERDDMSLWHQNIEAEVSDRVIDTLLSFNWVLVRTGPGMLLTSDNPIYFHEHEGLGGARSELTFPLSPSSALWATREPISDGSVFAAKNSFAKELNRRTAHRSCRWVISATNADWIPGFLFKGSWTLNRLRL